MLSSQVAKIGIFLHTMILFCLKFWRICIKLTLTVGTEAKKWVVFVEFLWSFCGVFVDFLYLYALRVIIAARRVCDIPGG